MTEQTFNTSQDRQQQQIYAAKISIAGSIVLFLISAGVGVAVDSITLLLDAAASLVILVVAFLTHVSIKKIHLPADDFYNFGYGKYEPLTAAAQGGLIIATCVISIKFAIQDIIHPEDISNYNLAVVATFFSGILGMFITQHLKKIAIRTGSTMLKVASLHWFTDTLLSFGVCAGFFIGLLLHDLGYNKITPYVDPVMAIVLALFFIKAPVRTMIYNVRELLDAVPGEDIHGKVKKVVGQYKPKSFGVYRLRTRKAGEKVFVDVCFIVKDNLTVIEVEELANSFERDLKNHLPNCDVVAYFKPIRSAKRP
ncbi:MAG: cation diffusion facilitator family transporter [Candidatus Omnitrophica bacterium]|nr:cation diffusion facilitator family transporter [Candidatus Omnitrophota bacterium]MDD5236272.1 cation diffusion facilitator family transporter [Candidatus Omnitrophota bacterium]MDD5611191.1 cation diffusion facilitator family transporter [Candidatus Omnitrophota bacterium]